MKISRSKLVSIISFCLIIILLFSYVFYLINKTNKSKETYTYNKDNINNNITIVEIDNKEIINEDILTDEEDKEENIKELVYENYTIEELAVKLEESLNSDISGYGNFIANYAIEKGVDPFLATAIMLHETGCTWNCSNLVKSCNNVGGMKGSGCGSYGYFNTLEEGIVHFIDNIYNNYYLYGLTTADLMGGKYAEDPLWSSKVNKIQERIKN